MSFTPTAGKVALIQAGPASGTPAAATVPGINWDLKIDAKLKDISNFAEGRSHKETLEDAELSFTLVWDAAAMPHDPAGAGIDAGLNITAKLMTDAAKFYTGTFKIATVGPNVSGLEDVLMYPVTAKLVGTLTRPVIA